MLRLAQEGERFDATDIVGISSTPTKTSSK
jgi:hypothetical protein